MVISSSAISVASPSAMAGYSHSGCGATVLSLTQAAASRIGEDGGHPAEVGGGEPVCGVEGESVLEIVGDGAAADVVSDVIVLLADVDHILSAELCGPSRDCSLNTNTLLSALVSCVPASGNWLIIFNTH